MSPIEITIPANQIIPFCTYEVNSAEYFHNLIISDSVKAAAFGLGNKIGGTYEQSDHSPRVRIGHRLRAGPVCIAVSRGSGGDHCSCRFRFSISAMISF